MRELTPFQNGLLMTGGVLVIAGAATFMLWPIAAFVLFTVGAILFSAMQLQQQYEGRNFALRRLRRQQLLGCVALLVTACCMAMQAFRFGFTRRNEWVVCLAVACVLLLYTAFRIPAELKKE
jgi:cell division protein FtsW (lipid II flippase)